jgi:hypothetical protein|uniref:Uncharacterized protein n=1 Tax=viral metagenome TaxID=1070528 RepID=A0A6C0BFX2_9ZZZZ
MADVKWMEKKTEFQDRFNTLVTRNNIEQLVANLDAATARYISKGGLSQNSDPNVNPDYADVIRLSQEAEQIKTKYMSLNDDILKFVKEQAKYNNMSDLLTETGTLQKEINGLQRIQEEIKTDVESAVAREELLRSRDTDLTTHQLFILNRPVRRNMIPYLWVLSIVFVGIGLVLLRMMQPVLGVTNEEMAALSLSFWYQLTSFFTNNVTWIAIVGACMIVILFLGLKVGGIFG